MTELRPISEHFDGPPLIFWQKGLEWRNEEWERSYTRFETPEEEINKFKRRYRKFGLESWPRSLHIVELFCGRGNGLKALELLGFSHLEGVDLSAPLLQQYRGSARLYVGDCRQLRFPDESKEAVLVQGGLHHLPVFPDDFKQVLSEARRILRPNGRIVVVEPWLTPFLKMVHGVCRLRWVRRIWPKLDALGDMIEQERETYEQWLCKPSEILRLLDQFFRCGKRSICFGKIFYFGTKSSGIQGDKAAGSF